MAAVGWGGFSLWRGSASTVQGMKAEVAQEKDLDQRGLGFNYSERGTGLFCWLRLSAAGRRRTLKATRGCLHINPLTFLVHQLTHSRIKKRLINSWLKAMGAPRPEPRACSLLQTSDGPQLVLWVNTG